MKLSSPAFADGAPIPTLYTCDGDNISPELHWSALPDPTISLALIVEDPDAPGGTFTHWIVWNLDPGKGGIGAGEVPDGAVQGRNDFGNIGYGGPCPPPGHGVHHYHFRLYALLKELMLIEGSTVQQLRAVLDETTLGETELIGTYER
jgi:Raf kinase inhibitor-like YbhB/YbcL family protein